jgi:hypothetical protein
MPCRPARSLAIAVGLAGQVFAQMNTPTGSYNLGTPAVPGTRTPESNPATAVPSSPSPGAGGLATTPPTSTGVGITSPYATQGPGTSFGAAPPPIVSPSR